MDPVVKTNFIKHILYFEQHKHVLKIEQQRLGKKLKQFGGGVGVELGWERVAICCNAVV